MESTQNSTETIPQKPLVKKDPGRILAIISIVVGIVFLPLVGLILAIISFRISKKVGLKNVIAKVSIWINSIILVWQVLLVAVIAILLVVPAVQTRAVTTSFSTDVRSGDCTKAAEYMTPAGGSLIAAEEFCKQMKPVFGTSQKELSYENKDGKSTVIYSVEGGTKKFLKIVVDSGKVVNIYFSDSQDRLNNTYEEPQVPNIAN